MDYFGYAGSILHIDLSSGDIRREALPLSIARDFIGGAGLCHRLGYDLIKPGLEPLSPENPIIIGAGPFVGTFIPSTAQITGVYKEPLSGCISSAGGDMRFGPNMKWAGFDCLVVTGKSEKPAYIKIINDDVQICDARDLWGKDIPQTTEELWERYPGGGVIAIGQAGENLVKFAITAVDWVSVFGRGGLGAVMGSKNLKALVSRGTGSIKVAQPRKLKELVDGLFARAQRWPNREKCSRYGSMANWYNLLPQIMYRGNYSEALPYEVWTQRFGPEVYDSVFDGGIACPSCFIGCKHRLKIREGKNAGLKTRTGAFLNVALFGTRLDIESYQQGIEMLDQLDRYGLCLFTFSALMGFLFHLRQRGIITDTDVGGLSLAGDFDNIMAWIDSVTFRKGFGSVLANGWRDTIEKIDKGCEKYAAIIKGKDTLWEPRLGSLGTMEFEQIVGPRGAQSSVGGSPTYVRNVPREQMMGYVARMGASEQAIDRIFSDPTGINVGRLTRYAEDYSYMLMSSLGLCSRDFVSRFYDINLLSELYAAVTGDNLTPEGLMLHAERGWNVYKIHSIQQGFSRKDDQPPDIWFEPAKGPHGETMYLHDYYNTKIISREDVTKWLEDYYDERGWDRNKGMPTREKLVQLGLEYMAGNLD